MNDKTMIQNQIQELKQSLRMTNHYAINFADGKISEAEFAPIREQRKMWEQEICRLDAELSTY